MSTKTILVAHREGAVRDRFAVALADAHHRFVSAATASEARNVVSSKAALSLVLLDLGLAEDGVALVRELHEASGETVPLVIFSGSIGSAADVPALTSLRVGFINEHASTPQILPALAPFLFADNFNRRTSIRVAVSVPVWYRAGDLIGGAVTLDVAAGGVGIRTMEPLAKDTRVQVRFRLRGVTSELNAIGSVAWSDRRVGMGVQFEEIAPEDVGAIQTFIDEHG